MVQSFVWILGALGLFGIGALPLRAWTLAQRAWRAMARWQTFLVIVLALAATSLAAPFVWGLSRCLWGERCSATTSGGWINAMFVGAIYLGFELTAWFLCRLWRIRVQATPGGRHPAAPAAAMTNGP